MASERLERGNDTVGVGKRDTAQWGCPLPMLLLEARRFSVKRAVGVMRLDECRVAEARVGSVTKFVSDEAPLEMMGGFAVVSVGGGGVAMGPGLE